MNPFFPLNRLHALSIPCQPLSFSLCAKILSNSFVSSSLRLHACSFCSAHVQRLLFLRTPFDFTAAAAPATGGVAGEDDVAAGDDEAEFVVGDDELADMVADLLGDLAAAAAAAVPAEGGAAPVASRTRAASL